MWTTHWSLAEITVYPSPPIASITNETCNIRRWLQLERVFRRTVSQRVTELFDSKFRNTCSSRVSPIRKGRVVYRGFRSAPLTSVLLSLEYFIKLIDGLLAHIVVAISNTVKTNSPSHFHNATANKYKARRGTSHSATLVLAFRIHGSVASVCQVTPKQ